MVANTGDYIIRGVKGEYYPCKPDIFEMTYELSSALPQQEICINCDEQKETHEICMDCIGKLIKENQQEISDEEIEKEAEKRSKSFNGFTTYEKSAWVMACKWYREQLKQL
jgi:ribosomal protein L32